MKAKITQLIVCASVGAIFQTQPVAHSDEIRIESSTSEPATVAARPYEEEQISLSPDRRPRQGLGAEDLTRNERFAATPAYVTTYPSRREVGIQNRSIGRIEGTTDLTTTSAATTHPEAGATIQKTSLDNSYFEADIAPKVAIDRTPRKGLGAEDITRGSYASSDFVVRDPAGSDNSRLVHHKSVRTTKTEAERNREMETFRR
ncbi:MAG: hypothetical protein ABIQ35_15025 [Verrucomicrobiota bacterium]